MKLMPLLFFVHLITSSEAYMNEQPWPVLLYEKGTQANIPCIIKGEASAYFWKKGGTYQTSEHVAANVHGHPDTFANETHGKLTVTNNGTLLINDISAEDDSTYFCRVVSEESEHYASVTVYSQVFLHSFSLSIEQCPMLSHCKLHLQPGSRHKFTCTASFVSSLVDLRWGNYNGSVTTTARTLKENVDGSFNISVSIEIEYEKPSLLSCEANSPNMRGEFVTIELENTGETEDGTDTVCVAIIVIAVVLIVLIASSAIFLIVKRKPFKNNEHKQGKEYIPVSSTESPKSPEQVQPQNKENEELELLQKEVKSKDEQLKQLQAQLKSKDEDLPKSPEQGQLTTKENEERTYELERRNEKLQDEIKTKDKKLTQLQKDLEMKNEEIKKQSTKLEDKDKVIKVKNAETADYKEDIKKINSDYKKEIESLKAIIQQRNKQLGITGGEESIQSKSGEK